MLQKRISRDHRCTEKTECTTNCIWFTYNNYSKNSNKRDGAFVLTGKLLQPVVFIHSKKQATINHSLITFLWEMIKQFFCLQNCKICEKNIQWISDDNKDKGILANYTKFRERHTIFWFVTFWRKWATGPVNQRSKWPESTVCRNDCRWEMGSGQLNEILTYYTWMTDGSKIIIIIKRLTQAKLWFLEKTNRPHFKKHIKYCKIHDLYSVTEINLITIPIKLYVQNEKFVKIIKKKMLIWIIKVSLNIKTLAVL